MKTKCYIIFGIIILFSNSLFSQVKQNEILFKDTQGIPTFIKFKETKIKSSNSSIKSFLKKQYQLKENTDIKPKKKSLLIENGIKSQKFEQYYKGLKVEFNEIVVVSKNNTVKTINGKAHKIENSFDIKPKLSEKQALDYLLNKINAKKYAWEDKSYEELIKNESNNKNATNYPKGILIIIDKNLFDNVFEPVLAYKFNVYAIEPLSNAFYYVNASSGKLILEDAIIKHVQGTAYTRYSGQQTIETQQSSSSYRLRDYSRGSGIETYNMNKGLNFSNATDFTDNDNIWTTTEFHNSNKDDAGLDAHWGSEKTYDYFFQKHNRNSYDNNGGKIKNYVHYSSNYDNAFWDNTYKRMVYGDGGTVFDALTSIDIIAHEIGHGICSSTAGLVYQNESGAINEGLSDIWGAMVEYFADPTKQTYEIGEEIKLGGGSLRSMSNPNSRNLPDTYNGTYWYSGSGDSGGVHTNSSVLNYWFYLLAEGGSGTNDIGNSYNVNSIGKEKASKIVYRAENIYFTSTTTYSQARQLTIQVAEDLYGVNSIESTSTCQSWYAVGVGDNNCSVNITLTGNSNICNTSNYTYTLNNLPPNPNTNWSVTSNLQIINSNDSTLTIKSTNNSSNGLATITAIVNGITIKKDIWIGKPNIWVELENNSNLYDTAIFHLRGNNLQSQSISSIIWERIPPIDYGLLFDVQNGNYFGRGQGPNNNWAYDAKVTVGNSCGTTIKYFTVTPPPAVPCNNITFNEQGIVIENPCNNINGISEGNPIRNVLVYDFTGRLISRTSKNLSLSSLSNGIYIIKVELITGEILTKKIIK